MEILGNITIFKFIYNDNITVYITRIWDFYGIYNQDMGYL
jgi:hypothetical protein